MVPVARRAAVPQRVGPASRGLEGPGSVRRGPASAQCTAGSFSIRCLCTADAFAAVLGLLVLWLASVLRPLAHLELSPGPPSASPPAGRRPA